MFCFQQFSGYSSASTSQNSMLFLGNCLFNIRLYLLVQLLEFFFGLVLNLLDLFFGLVDGWEKEHGYFSLSELSTVRNRMGLGIERDTSFRPKPLRDIAPELYAAKAPS